ncbi:MAG TPA: tetratricopeptide repeat protein [Verrucomicrobiae bacterium]|nr:tetratricopeptide repeat protein [Verrucomicrobiae bacterium]
MTSRLTFLVTGLFACVALVACRSVSRTADARATVQSERAMERQAEAHAHYAQGALYELQGEPAPALDEFDRAARLDPGNEQLVVEIARRWLLQKKPDRALDLLKLGASQPGASAMLDVLLGTAYAQVGETNLAVTANQRAIKKSPQLLAGYQNLYVGHVQAGRPLEALNVLDAAAKQKDVNAEFLVGLAELYLNLETAAPSTRTNVQARLRPLLQRAKATATENLHTRLRLADAFNAAGEADEAATLYQALLAEVPQAPMLQENLRAKLTDIYLRGKDRGKAIEQLRAMVASDPLNMQAHYYLALLYAEAGDSEHAEEMYRKTIVLNPKFEQAYYDLAASQLGSSETNAVFRTLEQAQKKFGENFVSEFLLGVANARIGKYAEAVKRYTSAEVMARATDPKRLTPLFYFQMGSALERKGDYSEAVKYLEKALALKPEFPEAANYLGFMWAERGENLERARALIDQAVKAEPDNSAYLDSLAWVLFKQGRAQEALPVMLHAIAQAQEDHEMDATLYDHLGDIYAAQGDATKARDAWTKALNLGPDDTIRKKLDALPAAH